MLRRKRSVGAPKTPGFNPKVILYALVVITGLLSVVFSISAIFQRDQYFFTLAPVLTLTFILGLLYSSKIWSAPDWLKLFLFAIGLETSLVVMAAVFPSFGGAPYAVIAIDISLLLTSFLKRSRVGDWILSLGLIGATGTVLISVFPLFPQTQNAVLEVIIAGIAGVLTILNVILFLRQTLIATLRIKLIFGSLALILIPLAILSIISNQFLQTSIQEQANQSLKIAAQQTASKIDDFIKSNTESVIRESSLSSILSYIELDPESRSKSDEETELRATFQSLRTKEKVYSPSYGLINLLGENIFDSDQSNIGKSERFTVYFQQSAATGASYASSALFLPNTREAYIYFINPVRNANKQIVGFLRVRYDSRILQSLISENVGLIGTRSYPLLLDENGLRLGDGLSPNLLYRSVSQFSTEKYTELIQNRLLPPYLPQSMIAQEQADIANSIQNPSSLEFFTTNVDVQGIEIPHSGTVSRLSTKPWNVIYLQDQAGLTAALSDQNRLVTGLSVGIAGLVGILIMLVANLFTRPIVQLTEAAEKVSSGDLSVQAKVSSSDEIGILGNSFNMMTKQLREFIDTLENRVRERTLQLAEQNESLQFRSRQLQTLSDVARSIVSTRDINSLLTTVTTLVSERFDFYHVGIFLIDDLGEYAILRASNSSGGRKMLNRQHKLQVGQIGIVGYVTGTGQPRIATDVGEDAVYFDNPDLPDTKSEMALPLTVGDKIIGAFDVQSTKSNAFTQEDIELFSTLADQIAIAINNNQLFAETSQALEESQNLYRQYLKQEWTRQTSEIGSTNYRYTPSGLEPTSEDLPEIKMVLDSARPIFRNHKVEGKTTTVTSVMAVPIILRGEPIGVIHLEQSSEQEYVWSQNELSTVQSVAEQVGQTLENARLFEQTIRRADRERKVLEITGKIRATNDPQQMIQITLDELKRNLGATQAQIVINVANTDAAESSVSTTIANPSIEDKSPDRGDE